LVNAIRSVDVTSVKELAFVGSQTYLNFKNRKSIKLLMIFEKALQNSIITKKRFSKSNPKKELFF
jgi:hypothetical protein